MPLKTKLCVGLGFLFIIIFGVVFFYSYSIEKLSQESGNILKDNYASIVYSKNMLLALDDMQTSIGNGLFNPNSNRSEGYLSKLFISGKMEFEKNMNAEKNNITEIHESAYAELLSNNYGIYLNLCNQIQKGTGDKAIYFNEFVPAYEKLRQSIISISDVNMQAVERKNQLAKQDSAMMIKLSAIISAICLLLAFGYMWYFPFKIKGNIPGL